MSTTIIQSGLKVSIRINNNDTTGIIKGSSNYILNGINKKQLINSQFINQNISNCVNNILSDQNSNSWVIGSNSSFGGTTVTIGTTPNISNSMEINSIFGKGTVWFDNEGSPFGLLGIGMEFKTKSGTYYIYFEATPTGSQVEVFSCTSLNLKTNAQGIQILSGIVEGEGKGGYIVIYNGNESNPSWISSFYNVKPPIQCSISETIQNQNTNINWTFNKDFSTGQSSFTSPYYYPNFSTIQALMGMAHACFLVSSYNQFNNSQPNYTPSIKTQETATTIFLNASSLGYLVEGFTNN